MTLYTLDDSQVWSIIGLILVLGLYTAFTIFAARNYLFMRFKSIFMGKKEVMAADMLGGYEWHNGEIRNGWLRQSYGDYEVINAAVRGESTFNLLFKPFGYLASIPWIAAVNTLESMGLHGLQDALNRYDLEWFEGKQSQFAEFIKQQEKELEERRKIDKTAVINIPSIQLEAIKWEGRNALLKLKCHITPFTLATNIAYTNWALKVGTAQENKNVMDREINIHDRKMVELIKEMKMPKLTFQNIIMVSIIVLAFALAYVMIQSGSVPKI